MDCSVYAGIPFCPTRCSYCSFVSRTVGDKATRALVQPYVDKLCAELTAIRETADRCGLHIRTFYIGGGTPTSLSAAQLEQLMSHIAKTFDLAKLDEYTVEAGRPDCTDAEKLRIIKKIRCYTHFYQSADLFGSGAAEHRAPPHRAGHH